MQECMTKTNFQQQQRIISENFITFFNNDFTFNHNTKDKKQITKNMR